MALQFAYRHAKITTYPATTSRRHWFVAVEAIALPGSPVFDLTANEARQMAADLLAMAEDAEAREAEGRAVMGAARQARKVA